MKRRIAAFVLGTALCAAAPSVAEEAPYPETVAIYSDICIHDESGDLLGDRILIINGYGSTFAVLQTAQGVLNQSDIAWATVTRGKISFEIDEPNGAKFEGEITADAIIGEFQPPRESSDGSTTFRLARQPNEQQPTPVC